LFTITPQSDVKLTSLFGSWFRVFSLYPQACRFWSYKSAGVTFIKTYF